MQSKARTISLSPKLADLVDEKVASGDYDSAGEVVRAGLHLLDQHDRLQNAKLEALKTDIQVGLDDLENGRTQSADEVFAELRERSRRHD